MKTRNWSYAKLIKYSFFFFFFFFLLLETGFRIWFKIKYSGCHTSVNIQGNTIQTNDTLLIFKNRPFYTDYRMRFQFNEEGMKVSVRQPFMPVKKSTDFWIFLFGASAMEGMGSNKTGEWINITGEEDRPWEETIGGYLTKILQKKIPGKKVTVFCAAASSYRLYQSMLRYESLAQKFSMDWVISLDGNNESPAIDKVFNTRQFITQDWQSYPIHHFPSKWILPFTKNSALINTIKQAVYTYKQQKKITNEEKSGFPAKKRWYVEKPPGLLYDIKNEKVNNAAQFFINELIQFDNLLTAKKQKHLLLVQPHISLRQQKNTDSTEKAVFNYYASAFNNPLVNSFQYLIHSNAKLNSQNIFPLDYLHYADFPVFVDYCHFTDRANYSIAEWIAYKILEKK